MDLSALHGAAAADVASKNAGRKRRLELPLKKRYQSSDAASLSELPLINRSNCSPSDDRASSDDSALPKTPCSAQSSSSVDADDCNEFALDFTLPNRSRAKLRSISKLERDRDHGVDHGFESASTSSAASVQEEPLDLTEKPPLEIHARKRHSDSTAQLPIGLFGPGFIPFPVASINGQLASIQGLLYPDFYAQSAPVVPSSPTGAKRPKLASMKQLKKIDISKPNLGFAIESTKSASLAQSLEEQRDELDEDLLLNKLKRNYKNMTVERRMEANARERTRVHTIGAAFDRLRKLVPSSTSDQKLSKLSILRIACRYIMLLASMNGLDYSLEQRGYSVQECIDMLTDTINVESKFKRVP